MNSQLVKISKVKMNKSNPRFIRDNKFNRLVASIKEFPEMLKLRPIVVNQDMIVLGGNMRLKACKEAGLKEVYILVAEELTEEQQREFIIKDNNSFGEWDWDIIANEWNEVKLEEWGLDVWKGEPESDMSLLDDFDDSIVDDMQNGVKRGIQIPFNLEHYEEAFELIKFFRDRGDYVGMLIIQHLKQVRAEYEKN